MTKIQAKISRSVERLEARFGIPEWRRKDPLDELMLTLLSQNTNDANRDRAYNRLRERFPDWEDVLQADVDEIRDLISTAGLGNQKSKRMKAILAWVKEEFGELSLEALKSMNNDEAIDLLTTQKGIGVKTAAVMLAFSLDRDICPVDTHVHRISIRQGWVSDNLSAEKTFRALRPLIPAKKAATFHLNLLKFGRNICRARNPVCIDCPLWDDCVWKNKGSKVQ